MDRDDDLLSPDHPRFVGPYRLLRPLGEGGMGQVYEAEQTRPVHRRVAVKIIRRGLDSREIVARFEAERQALAVMDHSNIARVFDGDETAEGLPYFVMELVKGTPITEYSDTHRLATPDRLELFVQVCSAVQHAHQKGIIHRDLKPSNVLVAVEDAEPIPKVIDFGIAKAIGHDLTDTTLVTEIGVPLGTPAYMSPEHAAMSGLDVDSRTDIYSLGVMLYELLVGAVPLDLRGVPLPARLVAIRQEEPPTPSTRLLTLSGDQRETVARCRHTNPEDLGRVLRGDLDWVVMKCLEKDRTRRYQAASELATELERYLADEPVQARPPSAGYRLGKFVRRHRTAVAAAAIAIFALVAGTTTATVGMLRARQAEADTQRLLNAERRALARRSAGDRVGADVVRAQASLLAAAPELTSRLKAELDLAFAGPATWQAQQEMADVYAELGYDEAAVGRLHAALDQSGLETENRVDLLHRLGEIHNRQERWGDAETALTAALSLAGGAGSPRPPGLLRTLATAKEGLGDAEAAAALREEARLLTERFTSPDSDDR